MTVYMKTTKLDWTRYLPEINSAMADRDIGELAGMLERLDALKKDIADHIARVNSRLHSRWSPDEIKQAKRDCEEDV